MKNEVEKYSFLETLDKMSFHNSFFLIGHGSPNLRYFNSEQAQKLADIFCREETDLIYTRHLYYTDFTRYGCQVKYFNVVSSLVKYF